MKKIALIFLLMSFAPLWAQDAPPPKIRIAVMKIAANNCPQSLGSATEELLTAHLFETNLFTLLEKAQMDRIAQKAGFTDFDSSDNEQMARLGKILSVEKIIVGSINKIGDYRIDVRCIDVKTASVDISASSTAENEGEIEKVIQSLSEKIEREYQGFGRLTDKYDLEFGGGLLFPSGSLANAGNVCYGGFVQGSINNILWKNICIIPEAGIYSMNITKESIDSLLLLPLSASLGYKFRITKTLTIRPSFGGGTLVSFLSYDVDDKKTSGKYNFVSKKYYDGFMKMSADVSLFIQNRTELLLKPEYYFIPGDKAAHLYGLNFGLKILF